MVGIVGMVDDDVQVAGAGGGVGGVGAAEGVGSGEGGARQGWRGAAVVEVGGGGKVGGESRQGAALEGEVIAVAVVGGARVASRVGARRHVGSGRIAPQQTRPRVCRVRVAIASSRRACGARRMSSPDGRPGRGGGIRLARRRG